MTFLMSPSDTSALDQGLRPISPHESLLIEVTAKVDDVLVGDVRPKGAWDIGFLLYEEKVAHNHTRQDLEKQRERCKIAEKTAWSQSMQRTEAIRDARRVNTQLEESRKANRALRTELAEVKGRVHTQGTGNSSIYSTHDVGDSALAVPLVKADPPITVSTPGPNSRLLRRITQRVPASEPATDFNLFGEPSEADYTPFEEDLEQSTF